MASDLGRGYDEFTDALRREGVPFLVLYGPDVMTDRTARREATIGIWIPDLPEATDAYDRAFAALKNFPIRPIVHPWHRLHPENGIVSNVSHGGRAFRISVRPEPEFVAALAVAIITPDLSGPYPVAAAPLRSAFYAKVRRNEEAMAFDAERERSARREQERASEARILAFIAEQKAARRKVGAEGAE